MGDAEQGKMRATIRRMPFVGATGGAFGYGRAAPAAAKNIVTAGIQLYLDGATYPGSGANWPDISGLG